MTGALVQHIYTHCSPGEFRAAAVDSTDRPIRLFSQRWAGRGERIRYGSVAEARLRAYGDHLRGAFCELSSGEEVFMRLKTRDGTSEGMTLRIKVASEARQDKLARVMVTDAPVDDEAAAYTAWRSDLRIDETVGNTENAAIVQAAFDDALSESVTLPGGGRLHVDRTRALTTFDIDTAGRASKGSAAARALSINQEAAQEMARQIGVRGLGGLFVLDCVSPRNSEANRRVQDAAERGFESLALTGARVLKPSPLGLLEASLPWRYMPVEDERAADPAETELLDLLREAQHTAMASPVKFYHLALCGRVWQAYLNRKSETDRALQAEFSGRVSVVESSAQENKVMPR